MREKKLQPDSLATYIDLLENKIPEEMFSKEFLKSAKRLFNIFPASVTNTFGFEYNLNIDVGLAGLALAIPSRREYKISFVKFLSEYATNYHLRYKPWKILKKVSNEWVDVSSLLYSNLLGIWLEFDFPLNLTTLPIPNLFFGPLRGGNREVIEYLVSLLVENRNVINNVMNCIEQLPDGCQVFHIGRMFSRRRKGIRLVAKGFDKDDLVAYLGRIRWKEDQRFINIIEEIPSSVNRILINFEINKKIDPHIGIEFSFKPDKLCREERWYEFLNWLSMKGLIGSKLVESLLAFPGLTVLPSANKKYSDMLIARYIGHIKIVYKGINKYLTKSYLAVRTYRTNYHY